jgi:hypothetical protein
MVSDELEKRRKVRPKAAKNINNERKKGKLGIGRERCILGNLEVLIISDGPGGSIGTSVGGGQGIWDTEVKRITSSTQVSFNVRTP